MKPQIDWSKYNDSVHLLRYCSLCNGEIKTLTEAEIDQLNKNIEICHASATQLNGITKTARIRFYAQKYGSKDT